MKKIKSINTFTINSEIEKEYHSMREVRDENGNIISQEQLYMDGSLEQKVERIYNEKNELIEQQQFTSEDAPDQVVKYVYNADGKLEQIATHYLDGSITFHRYERNLSENSTNIKIVDDQDYIEGNEYRVFDNENRVLEEKIEGEENKLVYHIFNRYNDEGKIIQRKIIDEHEMESTYNYAYEINDKGLMNEMQITNENNEVFRTETFQYDDKGNVIQHSILDIANGHHIIDYRTYDEQDNIIHFERKKPNGDLIEESHFKYNEDNRLIEEESRNAQGVVINYHEYELY